MLKTLFRASVMVTIAIFALVASPTIANETDLAGEQPVINTPETKPGTMVVTIVASRDTRADRLGKYLAAKGSPLAAHAPEFVSIADKYGLDWRFLPAVTGLESTYGLAVPFGSYNPYGWNNGKYRFRNWVEATEIVASGIRIRYAPSGEVTPWRIGRMYAASPTWAVRVAANMSAIALFR